MPEIIHCRSKYCLVAIVMCNMNILCIIAHLFLWWYNNTLIQVTLWFSAMFSLFVFTYIHGTVLYNCTIPRWKISSWCSLLHCEQVHCCVAVGFLFYWHLYVYQIQVHYIRTMTIPFRVSHKHIHKYVAKYKCYLVMHSTYINLVPK